MKSICDCLTDVLKVIDVLLYHCGCWTAYSLHARLLMQLANKSSHDYIVSTVVATMETTVKTTNYKLVTDNLSLYCFILSSL